MASTGVIGEPLPAEKHHRDPRHAGASGRGRWLARRGRSDHDDRHLSQARHRAPPMIDGKRVTINGIAKGSGMIAPDMATMLAFVFTDAQSARRRCCRNCWRAGVKPLVQRHHRRQRHLDQRHAAAVRDRQGRAAIPRSQRRPTSGSTISADAAGRVLLDLALQVVRDGEGAQKLIRIDVTGAESDDAAQAHRARRRQFAAGEDGDRRRRRQLGPRRHGGRQGGRGGRPRQAQDRVSASRSWPRRASARARLQRGRRDQGRVRPRGRNRRSISGSARARRGFGPAI